MRGSEGSGPPGGGPEDGSPEDGGPEDGGPPGDGSRRAGATGGDPAAAARSLRYVVDVKTLEMLVCPLTKTRLMLSADGTELVSVVARLAFPIRDGVPLLSLDEAREISDDELHSRLPELGGE